MNGRESEIIKITRLERARSSWNKGKEDVQYKMDDG